MTATERIWAFRTEAFIDGEICGGWTANCLTERAVEFVRADLAPDAALVAELVEVLRITRDRLLSVLHSEFDGVWCDQDFLDEVKEADAALQKWDARP